MGGIAAVVNKKGARDAGDDLKARIVQGLALSEEQSGLFSEMLQQGQQAGQQDIQSALGALRGAGQEQQGFLGQAQGQFGNIAGLTDPALANLQQTGTAGGRAQSLQNILSDPNQQGMFDALSRQTQNSLSGQGGLSRRSGFGIGQDESARLGLANQMLNQQDASQQGLANMGMSGQQNIANILSNRGMAAGQQGSALAGMLGQSAGFQQQGGINAANLAQQNLANELNLIGQMGQAESAATLGAANATAQGAQQMGNTAANAGMMWMMSDERLKDNIKKVGKTDGGLNIYTYNYKGDDTQQMGVMAQEAREMFPGSVAEDATGFLMVNYGGIK